MQRQADQVHTLTVKTVEDTMAMKLLTLIAVVYLPASFTAVRLFANLLPLALLTKHICNRVFAAWDMLKSRARPTEVCP